MVTANAKQTPFLYTNELTRCLKLVEQTKNQPVLLREVLANLGKHRVHRDRALSELTRLCKARLGALSFADYPAVRMLLALYLAFPEIASREMVEGCIRAKIADRGIGLFLIKISARLVRDGIEVDLSLLVDRGIEELFGNDAERDYLFLELLHQLAQRQRLLKEQVEFLEQRLSAPPALVLAPKLLQLAKVLPLRYTIPGEAVSRKNNGLYLRTLDALASLGCVCTKERMQEVCPAIEKQAVQVSFREFIQKTVSKAEFADCSVPTRELFAISVVARIKRLVFSSAPADEVVEDVKKLLQAEGM